MFQSRGLSNRESEVNREGSQAGKQEVAVPSSDEPNTKDSERVQKPAEYYSTTPLILDAAANIPLKSSEYASSHNDPFGIQRNWFTSLYKQLNYLAKTGAVPLIQGRQRQVFEAVEREFEILYDRHVKAAVGVVASSGIEQRAVVLMCLSIATLRVLEKEFPDPAMAMDVIRTNQGSMMMAVLMPIHRTKIWLQRNLLAEDSMRTAAQFLTVLQSDMGSLCQSDVVVTGKEARSGEVAEIVKSKRHKIPDDISLVVRDCKYHSLLKAEGATTLLPDFCCQHGMVFMREFQKYGVDVNLDRCLDWEDDCCSIRIAREGKNRLS